MTTASDKNIPAVLLISGNDPSGGAGVCADIETVFALGCHAAPVLTSLTVQDTRNAYDVLAIDPDFVVSQIKIVCEDFAPVAVKIGLLASGDIAMAVADTLAGTAGGKIVLDPVLAAAGGATLGDGHLGKSLVDRLMPLTLVVTPNARELASLTGFSDPERGAMALIDAGARHVLLKGADVETSDVINRMYSADGLISELCWERLPHQYHGSGCTLASAIAALIAHGHDPVDACELAQAMVWDWLSNGFRPGRGQYIPGRREYRDDDD